MEELQQQLSDFLSTVIETPKLNYIFHDVLGQSGLQITQNRPIADLISDVDDQSLKDYLEKGLKILIRKYQIENGFSPNNLQEIIDKLKVDYSASVELGDEPGMPDENPNIPPIPLFTGKNRSNREAGVREFVENCVESKSLVNSVALHNHYISWCNARGYGVCTAPTLTKYLREATIKDKESLSDKNRSQGWFISPPAI